VKIGFFGNTNNYPIMLARALRSLGHEVQFIVDQADALYRPEYRYPDLEPYPDWIHDVSPVRFRHYFFPNGRRARILRILRSCDALVLNQHGPSLLHFVDRPAIALLTGSDLETFANPASSHLREGGPVFRAMMSTLLSRQREGIAKARAVSFFSRGASPPGDRLLDGMGVGDERRFFVHMTDVDLIRPHPPPQNPTLRIFCATRLNWKMPMRPGSCVLDYKGSDIMVRGLGRFVRATGVRLDIQLVEKGWDVEPTRALVDSEGLREMVTWNPEMTQKQILDHFAAADVVFEQLSSSLIGMAGLDAMAVQRPLIANARPELGGASAALARVIAQAATADEVCAQLRRLVDASVRQQVADESRRHIEAFHSAAHAARDCLRRLEPAA
jgi:hypothetical protein